MYHLHAIAQWAMDYMIKTNTLVRRAARFELHFFSLKREIIDPSVLVENCQLFDIFGHDWNFLFNQVRLLYASM
jgi:hypothetical protein